MANTKAEMRRVLGFFNYFREYIPNCAKMAKPLYKQNTSKQQMLRAFENIKKALVDSNNTLRQK